MDTPLLLAIFNVFVQSRFENELSRPIRTVMQTAEPRHFARTLKKNVVAQPNKEPVLLSNRADG
jgi:hypothetical protein